MNQDKIYYNTEYRKKIKALSKFNIFIKDRLTKRDEINEPRLKKKKELLAPLLYRNLFKLYFLIKSIYNKWIYKINYDLNLNLKFLSLKENNKKINIFFKNQLILEYLFNGIFYFFLIINWLWINEWNKWASFTDILEYKFFNILIMFQYINNYNREFIYCFMNLYKFIIYDFFYNLKISDNIINVYNIYILNELNIFFVIYNVEEIKLEHDKTITPKNKLKDIKKISLNYLNLDILNNSYYLSFFSFNIFEFYIRFNNIYNMHFITLTFFEYWVDIIIERNVKIYNSKKNKKQLFKFKYFDLKNIYTRIYKKKFFPLRVKYNLLLNNIDYFIFLKGLTFNFYIRNCNYFFEFISQRKLFLKYNNPTSLNKGSISIWDYDKLYKKMLLLYRYDMNNYFNLFNIKRIEPFLNFYYKNNKKKWNYIINSFLKNFNVKFLYKLNNSKSFFFSINKFFDFNLIDFYNYKNRLDSYKNVMAINSVYEYRYANSSFRTMEEFMLTIFKTPLENYIYFNDSYQEFSYNIAFENYLNLEKFYFFQDLNNSVNNYKLKFFSIFLKFCSKLFKMRIYFFKLNYLHNLMENEEGENLLKIDVFSRFYDIFEKRYFFSLMHKFKRKNFYKRWSLSKFFNILKNNTMFYLEIYNIYILFSGWLYEISFFSKLILYVKIYNKILNSFNLYEYYKYVISFKDFFFQLIYENLEFSLIYLFIYTKKIKNNNNYNYLNNKNKINNNFIFRKYVLYTRLEYNYYNDLFDDLDFFEKGNYSIKLSKWILRYFYKKTELYMYYSESLANNYINKNRFFL